MRAVLPDFLIESETTIVIMPFLVTSFIVHPLPKSMVIVFGKPCAGVMSTVAHPNIFIDWVTVTGTLPEKLFVTAVSIKISFASSVIFSVIASLPLNSTVVVISSSDELVVLSFLHDAKQIAVNDTAVQRIRFLIFIILFL